MREAVIERSAGDVSETFPIESLPRHSALASCPWHARDSSERHRRCSDLWRPVWHPTVHETVLEVVAALAAAPPRWHDRFSFFLPMQACASVSATTPEPRCLPIQPQLTSPNLG